MAFGTRWLGLRRIDYSIECQCVLVDANGVRTPTRSCRRCMGLGYPFVDHLVKGYFWKSFFTGTIFPSEVGRISTQGRNLVVQHNQPVNKFDWVLLLDLDPDNGEPRQPFSIQQSFIVVDSIAMRGKNGRVEFWRCTLQERNISDGRPGEEGTGFTITNI